MNDPGMPSLHATPDGEAELAVVLRLAWEDVAALGQEASRLAASAQRPVTLDEAASHRLRRHRPGAAHARPQTAPSPVASLPRSPADTARQAIDKINGTAGPASAQTGPTSAQTGPTSAQGA
ncbi:hypothetical protein [Streptomyces minutiscleroticus]|uniref:Uncharacterized protein n=1 Tax=Streptomyces minutiscleroticus TaxID=68238 RepID=A0A918NY05_9ACTN|nr:hypothetical protein [Streptomyces minutiscleroticus]GGY04711.1 hypothetical protein GCM10010358_67720 [Streptomyces minutiscleroticus]